MKKAALLICLLFCAFPAWGETDNEKKLYAALLAQNSALGPEVEFLRTTTTFVIPDASWQFMLGTDPYGGVTKARNFASTMIAYFEANGFPGLRSSLAAGSRNVLDRLRQDYGFKLVYEGPPDKSKWRNFVNYWGLLYDSQEMFDAGWVPTTGQTHLTLTVTGSTESFKAASNDGKSFEVLAPIEEVPTSLWAREARPVFLQHGKAGNRP